MSTTSYLEINFQCLANCFSPNDIFQNDEINRDELIKVLESQTDDSAWTPIHSAAVDKCIEVLQRDLKNIQSVKEAHQCNRVAVLMLLCLNGQYFARCPDTHFQNDSMWSLHLCIYEFYEFLFILDENCKKFQEHIKTCPMPRMGPWGHGKKGFAGRRGGNFRPNGPGYFGSGSFGPGPNFDGGHFGPGPHSGQGPNFGTGQVFGFL